MSEETISNGWLKNILNPKFSVAVFSDDSLEIAFGADFTRTVVRNLKTGEIELDVPFTAETTAQIVRDYGERMPMLGGFSTFYKGLVEA